MSRFFQDPSPADLLTESYAYDLPSERIAQTPISPRDQARLLVVGPSQQLHSYFYELPRWLRAGDLLVLNDTRVIPARLYGHKLTGAPVEVLLLEERSQGVWLALVKPGRRLHPGDRIRFAEGLEAEVEATDPESGGRILRFHWPSPESFAQVLERVGQVPFPPYIVDSAATPADYQTVWAARPGSVAAPTAGLHFTTELLAKLAAMGVGTTPITLNIGLGTFRPVDAESVTQHHLHQEWLQVSPEAVERIRATQAAGGRVIAVGTTVVRALETAAQGGCLQAWQGKSGLFIYPGYCWRVVEGLITNFHLPRSSLLMLVSALIGRQRLLALYAEAIALEYRFYSFGDGMVILPQDPEMD